MRRSFLRRHIGEPVSVRLPQGQWEGRIDAAPRGSVVISGHQFTLSNLDGAFVDGRLELRTWSAPATLTALLSDLQRPIRGAVGGVNVSPKSAVEGTIAVYACVSLRAEMIAALPAHLYQRQTNTRRKEVDYGDRYPGSLARMVGEQPNPEMTSNEFWETVVGHHDLWGDFYGNVERDLDGHPRYIWPLNPSTTTAIRDKETGRKFLRTHVGGGKTLDLKPEEYTHIRGPISTDGLNGLSPIGVARTSVGTEQAAGEHGARVFTNGAEPGGILTVEGKLADEDRKMIRERWQETHGGMTNAHRVAVLGGGVTWQAVGMSNHDAEFLATRKYEVEQIARLYRVPPHMIQDVDRSTSWGTGIESQNLGLHTYTLRPVMVRIEQALGRDLGFADTGKLLADEDLYVAFDASHFLRADALTQAQVFAIERQWGIINADEWRADLDMEPIAGDAGKVYIDPANYVFIPQGGKLPPGPWDAKVNQPAPAPGAAASPAGGNGKVPVKAG